MRIGKLNDLIGGESGDGSSSGSVLIPLPNPVEQIKTRYIGVNGFSVSWNDVNDASSYKVIYKKDTVPTVSDIANGVEVANGLQCNVTGLQSGDLYNIWVVSLDGDGHVQTCKNSRNTDNITISSVGTSANIVELEYPTELNGKTIVLLRCREDGRLFVSTRASDSSAYGVWTLNDNYTWNRIGESLSIYRIDACVKYNGMYYLGGQQSYLFTFDGTNITQYSSSVTHTRPLLEYEGYIIFGTSLGVGYFNISNHTFTDIYSTSDNVYYTKYVKLTDNRFFFYNPNYGFIYWDGVIGDAGHGFLEGSSYVKPLTIYRDSRDRLFFYEGGSEYDNGKIYMWNTTDTKADLVLDMGTSGEFNQWFEDSVGNVYVYSKYNGYLAKFNETTKVFDTHDLGLEASTIFITSDDKILLVNNGFASYQSLKVVDKDDFTITSYTCSGKVFWNLNYIYEDLEGNVWISASDDASAYCGLYKFSGQTLSLALDNVWNMRARYEDTDKITFVQESSEASIKQYTYTKATQTFTVSELNGGLMAGIVGNQCMAFINNTSQTVSTITNSKTIVGNGYSSTSRWSTYWVAQDGTNNKLLINTNPQSSS